MRKSGQKEVLFPINRSKATRARRARRIGYNAASDHNSEAEHLPPTKDLVGISQPHSVPPIARWANLMLGIWPALHIVSGVCAVFLSDRINRVIISGMTLSRVLASGAGGLDMARKTYIDTPL